MPMASEKSTSANAAAACRDSRRANRRPGSSLSARCSYMPEAILRVVVHHADGLHEGIADGRTDEAEATLEKILAHRFRVLEAPDVGVEAAEFLLHREEGLRVGDRAVDFQPVADNARVFH